MLEAVASFSRKQFTSATGRKTNRGSDSFAPPPQTQADDPLFLAWVDDETTFYKMFGRRDFYIDTVQEIPMSCYMAPTSLK